MDLGGAIVGKASRELPQHFPERGWVEHDPDELWETVVRAVAEALRAAGVDGSSVAAVGITNQRETTLLWDRSTGQPARKAIVWQDRRTADRCSELRAQGHEAEVRATTGLVLDPYFSATKIAWVLNDDPGLRRRAEGGTLAFGTVDSYLVFRLAGGSRAGAPHVTDVTNASRTLLYDLERHAYSGRMCDLFAIPPCMLPRLVPSAGVVARTVGFPGLADGIPISGLAGDQHAALFGQACFAPGDAKCTYGTGAFLLVNTGTSAQRSTSGLVTTVAWQVGNEITYALEGSVFIAGAAVQWLRDGLGLIASAAEVERLARGVDSSDGVVFVPALAGLGAPHWDPAARGTITGLTRRTTAAHLARATLEGVAFQIDDLLGAVARDRGAPVRSLRVDGGAAANDLLLAFQSDLSGIAVVRPTDLESTGRGAAMLAGLGVGLFGSPEEAARMIGTERTFVPAMTEAERAAHRSRWRDAVVRARSSEAGMALPVAGE
ncbi:MAG: glycerol kinase GlpK [Polyangiaceae bacterium]|nr:glycerol kinase GlpK [Polyangiaceae bacterium]